MDYEGFTVDKLKDELKQRGCTDSKILRGKKSELIEKLLSIDAGENLNDSKEKEDGNDDEPKNQPTNNWSAVVDSPPEKSNSGYNNNSNSNYEDGLEENDGESREERSYRREERTSSGILFEIHKKTLY